MTLDTRVYVQGPIDYREVWVKCNQLIGADEGIKFADEPFDDARWIWNKPGQGLCALLDLKYREDAPLMLAGQHRKYCEREADECYEPCAVPCWLEISFDTAYGYQGDNGEGCGDLHARLVAQLGQWLDGKGIAWSWTNEFTGETHQGCKGLAELGPGGAEASAWFRDIVAPALGLDAS